MFTRGCRGTKTRFEDDDDSEEDDDDEKKSRDSYHENNSNKDDEVYRVMSKNQELSVLSVTATKMVAEAQGRHKAAPTATAAIGRNLIASLLLGSFKGDEETVQVTFRGDGPLGQLTAVSDNLGNAKCLVGNREADPPLRADGKLNVGMAVGKGILSVSRSHPSWVQPYNGQVSIYTGEIAEDIAVYMRDTANRRTARFRSACSWIES